MSFNSECRSLTTTALYSNGTWLMMLPTLFVGGTLHVMNGFDPRAFVNLVQKERITHTFLVPPQFSAILSLENIQKDSFSSLKTILSAGSPLRLDVKEKILSNIRDKCCCCSQELHHSKRRSFFKSSWFFFPQPPLIASFTEKYSLILRLKPTVCACMDKNRSTYGCRDGDGGQCTDICIYGHGIFLRTETTQSYSRFSQVPRKPRQAAATEATYTKQW